MSEIEAALRRLAHQNQFLDVVDREEATVRFHRHLELRPIGSETVPLSQALNRVLAKPIVAEVDVPGFDRSSVDGFAVCAGDTVGASEQTPKTLTLNNEILTPGAAPQAAVAAGPPAPLPTRGRGAPGAGRGGTLGRTGAR